MIKYLNYDIVFAEVPDEVTLAINLTQCPNNCIGCHSSILAEDIGEELTEQKLSELIDNSDGITCVSFMGGDNDIEEISNLAEFLKFYYHGLKVAWYSGKSVIDNKINLDYLDYVKIGPYIPERGPLTNPNTNQIFYKINNKILVDITYRFCNIDILRNQLKSSIGLKWFNTIYENGANAIFDESMCKLQLDSMTDEDIYHVFKSYLNYEKLC